MMKMMIITPLTHVIVGWICAVQSSAKQC